jgi:pimeloyl-[acyl-carrier protein] methyl ester esterase
VSSLYYEVHGRKNGADLVLLHGWSLNLRVWDGVVRVLARERRVITLDLPGHGGSDWDARASTPAAQAWRVHETLEGLSERYTLLGWSLGGQIALDLAAALPSGIERLVLVSTTPRFLYGASWRCGTPRAQLARLVTQLHADGEQAVYDFLALAARGSTPRTSLRVLGTLREALKKDGWADEAALIAGLARLRDGDLRRSLASVRIPALVIAGQKDRVVHPAASRRLAAGLPHGRYVRITGAAHAPFLSHQAMFVRHLRAFLDG